MPTDEAKHVQDQILDAIKQSQNAVLEAVSTWSESVTKLVPNLPEMPKLPMSDVLPKPAQVSDQFFDLAQQLLASQQEFVEQLMAALPGQDTAGD